MTRPFRREDGRLDPSRAAAELERQVRAQAPWPGSFLETPAGRVAVLAASTAPADGERCPGVLVPHGDRLALTTSDGRLVLDELQLAGEARAGRATGLGPGRSADEAGQASARVRQT